MRIVCGQRVLHMPGCKNYGWKPVVTNRFNVQYYGTLLLLVVVCGLECLSYSNHQLVIFFREKEMALLFYIKDF